MKPEERRDQEAHAMREFLRLAESPDRNLREQRLALRLGQLLGHHRRLHIGGRDAVDRDAERRHFARQREGQRRSAPFEAV